MKCIHSFIIPHGNILIYLLSSFHDIFVICWATDILVFNFYSFYQHTFVLWYTQKTPGVRTQTSYEDSIKKIADFSSVKSVLGWFLIYYGILFFCQLASLLLRTFPSQVEAFWMCYCRLVRPANLPSSTDLHFFKEGIRPLWEVFTQTSRMVTIMFHVLFIGLFFSATRTLLTAMVESGSYDLRRLFPDAFGRTL